MSRVDLSEVRVERRRRDPAHRLSLLADIHVERGTKADWDALCELHYKGHTLAAGSRFMRCVIHRDGRDELIGIVVFGMPRPLDSGRNEVFPHLRPNTGGRDTTLINKRRMQWINKNLTWNNRTVVDTMYRSAGIAYRFKNLAYRMFCCAHNLRYVESRSSMGRFNPFSIKSGMKFIKPKQSNALEEGIRFFQGHFRSSPHDIVAIREELEAMPAGEREFAERRLREFYYKHSSMEKSGDKRLLGTSRVDQLDIGYVLRQIQQLVFSATVYWIWTNPDVGRTLPARLPLLAFDRQGVDQPLVLD